LYQKEIDILKKVNRFRERKIFSNRIIDFASNDYLGISENKVLLKKAFKRVLKEKYLSPKASQMVNGYSVIHKEFENNLKKINGFEDAIIVGSGFLANIALIESLIRQKDTLLIDEEYHSSGILASKLTTGNVIIFKHNDSEDLENRLKNIKMGRIFIAVEGIYSMSGDILNKDIFNLADKFKANLILDEAHSSGILGNNLLGILDYYNIKPKSNYIKMGTLGKAYGSYGAYILASKNIISFLENRAKPIIYSTSLSLFDTALGDKALKYIYKKRFKLNKRLTKRYKLEKEILKIDINSPILKIEINDNKKVIEFQKLLLENNFLVGAIRQPTVDKAIIRVILRLSNTLKDTKRLLKIIRNKINS